MNLGVPQILVIVIYVMQLVRALDNNGKIEEHKVNFGISVISKIIIFSLLYWGGFFN